MKKVHVFCKDIFFTNDFVKQTTPIMWTYAIAIDLHFSCVTCGLNVLSCNRRTIEVSPFGFWVLILQNVDKRNFEHSNNVVLRENVFISDLKCDVFGLVWDLSSNLNALIPFGVETLDVWSFHLISAEFGNHIGANLTAHKIQRD